MRHRLFKQVDVFSSSPCGGNPLAVVLDGSGLSDDEMQRFARWTNLSETTFLLPPSSAAADYRVRIFTPGGELPFAGHPTLGSCHAWLQAGGRPRAADRIVQECKKGLITLRRDGDRLAFGAPDMQRSDIPAATLQGLLQALGLRSEQVRSAQALDNGPVWYSLLLDSADTVRQLQPDHAALKALGTKVGVVAEQGAGADTQFEVRGFAAAIGVEEDPVTGSLNASLAQWLMETGVAPEQYVAAQGTCMGRQGRVFVQRVEQQVWIGGQSVTVIDGTVNL